MRRRDREVTEWSEICEIIKKSEVCSVAFFDEEYPYLIPMNFGAMFEEEKVILYFHGAKVGKKLDLLNKNNHVAFEMNCSRRLIAGDKACKYTMEFESVCGNGIMEEVPEEEKQQAFTALMKQYAPNETFEFRPEHMKAISLLRLSVKEITGKRLKKKQLETSL